MSVWDEMRAEICGRDVLRDRLRNSSNRFYVYTLWRPCGTPFYVGKGVGDRVFAHERDAANTTHKSHKLNTIRALSSGGHLISYCVEFFETEQEAHARERELIQRYGRHDLGAGPLTNMTDGGEGASNPSEVSRQRHRDTLAGVLEDGSARSTANAFFLKVGIPVGSVPIKPLGARRLEPLTPHPSPRSPTARQAAALVALAIGNRAILAPGCLLSRQFELEDGPAVLENGVGRDMLRSGMLDIKGVAPESEILAVTELGFQAAEQFVGRENLLSFGVLMPETDHADSVQPALMS